MFVGCTDTNENVQETNQRLEFGEKIAADQLITNNEFRALLKKESKANCVISGTIIALCKDGSCDFKITMFDGRDIPVKQAKNLTFIAKNQLNQSVILSGTATLNESDSQTIMFEATGIKIVGTESDKE